MSDGWIIGGAILIGAVLIAGAIRTLDKNVWTALSNLLNKK